MTRKTQIVSFISFTDENWWQKRCHGDDQYNFAVRFLRAHVAEVSGATIRVTDDMLVTMENPASIASVGAASGKDWPGNIFEGILCRYVGFEASLETFLASNFFVVLVTAFPRSGIFTMVTFQPIHCMEKYSTGNIVYYKITESLRALSLVDRCVSMRVCKHGCDVLDSRVFSRIIL